MRGLEGTRWRNRILEKSEIADGICRFIIEAPKIAKKRKAGNFVVVRANEYAERIPLTIVDSDLERGTYYAHRPERRQEHPPVELALRGR